MVPDLIRALPEEGSEGSGWRNGHFSINSTGHTCSEAAFFTRTCSLGQVFPPFRANEKLGSDGAQRSTEGTAGTFAHFSNVNAHRGPYQVLTSGKLTEDSEDLNPESVMGC